MTISWNARVTQGYEMNTYNKKDLSRCAQNERDRAKSNRNKLAQLKMHLSQDVGMVVK